MSRITRRTVTIFVSVLAMVLAMVSTALGSGAAVAAVGPPDRSKVPHYFGPWPNWANSPLTLNKASVTFTGTGTGATAVAQVDPASGGISAIDITSPGQGYDATTTVTIAGGTTAATATAAVSLSDVVTGFTNVVPGSGYTAFKVDLTGGVDLGIVGNLAATAIGSGGVDAVAVTDAGSGYIDADGRLRLPRRPQRHPGHRARRVRRGRPTARTPRTPPSRSRASSSTSPAPATRPRRR